MFTAQEGYPQSDIQISVEPLRGASATVENAQVDIVFGQIPAISFLRTSPYFQQYRAGLFDTYQSEQAQKIVNLINSYQWDRATPLPFSRGDIGVTGARGLKAVVKDVSEDILCFTGIGVVSAQQNKYGGIDKESPSISIDSPRPNEKVSQYRNVGTIVVDNEGHMWSERNDSPFGAYDSASLQEKLAKTETFGAKYGPKIIAAGRWEDTDMGWMVYTLPKDMLSSVEVLKLDLKLPETHRGELYGPIVAQIMRQVKETQTQEGAVHYQLHPGNWYVYFRNSSVAQVIFTDWETATKYEELPPSSDFIGKDEFSRQIDLEAYFEGLTPSQRAIALDLFNAFSSATLIDASVFKNKTLLEEKEAFSIETSSLWVTRDVIDYELSMLSYAVLAYTQGSFTLKERKDGQIKLFEIFRRKALRIAKDNQLYIGDDFEKLVKMGHSELALREAAKELFLDVSKTLAQSGGSKLLNDT